MTVGTYELIVVGAGPTGLTVASQAVRRGLRDVLVVEPGERAFPQEAVGRYGLTVRFRFVVLRMEELVGGDVLVESDSESFRAKLLVVVHTSAGAAPLFPISEGVAARCHTRLGGFDPMDRDVLVVGGGDDVVAAADELLAGGARVVVSFTGPHTVLSGVARQRLAELEHARRVTVLWHSCPDAIEAVEGYPMAFFDDRRIPDLQFDQVVSLFSDGSRLRSSGRIYRVDSMGGNDDPLGAARAWDTIATDRGEELPLARHGWLSPDTTREIEQLRIEHYNATITHFDFSHEDLWVIRVRPDQRDTVHRPGQYTTLGLGYWEPRADDADEGLSEDRRSSMIRRSYSISCRIFDDYGYLVDAGEEREIEFYIVHVRPSGDRIPALTPRLAGKRAGDRIYLGPKMAGRYTLDPVTDPEADVVFLATGTGEAPHNAMLTELFRKGHRGRIVSLVSVRHLRDLGYADANRKLEKYHPNYVYLPLPTREPEVEKRYVQEAVRSGELEAMLTHGLAPARTHVFMCGNPAMIGIPRWEDSTPGFPEPEGVAELLHRRGFTLDRRGVIGNVHYEEYW